MVFACSQKAKTAFPLQAEVEAVRWAISLAAKLEADNVIIETDSKICHDAIHELILPPALENFFYLSGHAVSSCILF